MFCYHLFMLHIIFAFVLLVLPSLSFAQSDALCNRTLLRFIDNPTALERVQHRIEKRFGFPCSRNQVQVLRVIDGDTIEVEQADGTTEKVRFIGIDTPEVQECFAAEATAYLAQLLEQKTVELLPQPTENRDKYGRLLRYVYFDSTDINNQLILLGYAKNYPWFPHPRIAQYARAEHIAQSSSRGLWNMCK